MQNDRLISSIVGNLMSDEPYYIPFISLTQFRRVKDAPFPYMGVYWNGANIVIIYNKEGLIELDSQERLGVLRHELAHYYLKHLTDQRNKVLTELAQERFPDGSTESIKNLVNIAMDLEINSMLKGVKLPKDGCFPESMGLPDNLLAEEYIKIIPAEMSETKSWNDVGPGKGNDEQLMDETQSKDIDNRIKEARGRGSISANVERILEKLNPPQVMWKRFFKKEMVSFVRSRNIIPTYARPNRRGLQIPGKMFKSKPNIYVWQDTSGSVSTKELGMLSSELFGMRRYANKIMVAVIDSVLQDTYEFKGKIESVKGGGGSDFSPALDWTKEHMKGSRKPIIVLLTDGDISVPDEKDMPGSVIWVLCQGDRNVPYGKKIVLDRP